MEKSFWISIPHNEENFLDTIVKLGDNEYDDYKFELDLNKSTYGLLTRVKNKIDEKPYNRVWDNYKKHSNDYELVHISLNKTKINNSVAFYIPLSRSYFKMWEMFHDFDILSTGSEQITTAHLAEGPGGFVEACVKYREKYSNATTHDDVNAITLRSDKKEIPGWKKSNIFLKKYPRINISFGVDGTGNLYNANNILHFVNDVGMHSCELVTADGGFDFSIDFNKQEESAYRLIFCEIVSALLLQKEGGSFVCKFFDTYSKSTVKLLYLLNCCYDKVIITKPITSRPANSERYIVAKGYHQVTRLYLIKLLDVIDNWEIMEFNGPIVDIFSDNIPPDYVNTIEHYNEEFAKNQMKSIMKTLQLIKTKQTQRKKLEQLEQQKVELKQREHDENKHNSEQHTEHTEHIEHTEHTEHTEHNGYDEYEPEEYSTRFDRNSSHYSYRGEYHNYNKKYNNYSNKDTKYKDNKLAGSKELDDPIMGDIIKTQVFNAIKWCEDYGVSINYRSKYITRDIMNECKIQQSNKD
jgi:23S rRNA U2552 (ribose-2'-O)-methylase RlmE/FtsJ